VLLQEATHAGPEAGLVERRGDRHAAHASGGRLPKTA
jgi:hypothetical protein